MDQAPVNSFEACCTAIVGDMAKALGERSGETPGRGVARAQGAAMMIMAFLPRDVIEATLASHCVMFHDLMVISAHDTLCAEDTEERRAGMQDLLALNKAFCGNLGHLKHYQKRVAEGSREAVAEAVGPESTAEGQQACQTSGGPVRSGPVRATTSAGREPMSPEKFSPVLRPDKEAIAARRDNPAAAAAAMKAGDAAGFARAMGIEQPSAAFLEAARAPGSPFDPGSSGPWPKTSGRAG